MNQKYVGHGSPHKLTLDTYWPQKYPWPWKLGHKNTLCSRSHADKYLINFQMALSPLLWELCGTQAFDIDNSTRANLHGLPKWWRHKLMPMNIFYRNYHYFKHTKSKTITWHTTLKTQLLTACPPTLPWARSSDSAWLMDSRLLTAFRMRSRSSGLVQQSATRRASSRIWRSDFSPAAADKQASVTD